MKSPNGTVQAGLHNAAQDIQVGYDAEGSIFTVSPVKFSQKVIETIESDFPTFEAVKSSRHRPARSRALRYDQSRRVLAAACRDSAV